MMRFAAVFILGLLITVDSSLAASRTLVEASMLSNASTVKPGEPFDVGVKLTMAPGWHTYWSNPGDAGLATQVKWTLPEGFTAGELQFPVPTRFDEPGGIVVYGYTGDVLLIATITPPANLIAGQSVKLAARVNWLCCAETCIPGKATVETTLVVGDHPQVSNGELFDLWRQRLPQKSEAKATPLRLSEATPHSEIFLPRAMEDAKSVIPGAVDGLIITVGSLKPATRDGKTGTTIAIDARALQGQTVTANSLTVLITSSEKTSDRRVGEAVSIPIEPSAKE